jgi:hypothetical protein
MQTPHTQNLGNMLDLTIPERMDKAPGSTRVTRMDSTAIVAKLTSHLARLRDLRTDIKVGLPWHGVALLAGRVSRTLPQAIVAVIAVMVLAGGLYLGASLVFLGWWAASTVALLWALAFDAALPADDKSQPTKETAVIALVALQFISFAVICMTFYIVKLK